MADLSAYIDFSVALDKSGVTPVMYLTDPDNYPDGVKQYVTGVFSITQPDGINITGSFTSPDVSWDGSELTTASKELRLATDDSFQNGLYTIVYTVQCTGYSPTVLTKIFTLTYTAATLNITDLTDVFTPSLEQLDSTIYLQDGFATPTVTREWDATIDFAGTSIGTKVGLAILFDMKYSGNYWDAKYLITFTAIVTYVMNTPSDFVTVIDKLTTDYQVDAYTPPTMQALAAQLTTMQQEVANGTYCGGRGCGCGCSDEQAFTNAQALYQLIKTNGCNGQTVGLQDYITELQKLFTCNGATTQMHNNSPIPAYNFGCGSSGNVTAPIQFTVGSGALYAPVADTFAYNNPTLEGNNAYIIFRQAIGDYLVSGTDFTYNTSGGFTLSNATAQGTAFVDTERFTLVFNSN